MSTFQFYFFFWCSNAANILLSEKKWARIKYDTKTMPTKHSAIYLFFICSKSGFRIVEQIYWIERQWFFEWWHHRHIRQTVRCLVRYFKCVHIGYDRVVVFLGFVQMVLCLRCKFFVQTRFAWMKLSCLEKFDGILQ